ncbi:MAG: hypothetical protein V3W14_06655 [Candidatus Neomarinimicrobiota bacterium]
MALAIEKLKAWTLLEAFNRLETDAVNIGDRDLAAGLTFLRVLADSARFPFLSANLVDAAGQPVFKPAVVVEKYGLRVGLIGASSVLPPGDDYRFLPLMPAVKREVEGLRLEVDVVAVLFHGTDADRDSLATSGLPIDFIFHSHVERFNPSLGQGRLPVINLGKEGRDLNVVSVEIRSPGEPLVNLTKPKKDLESVKRAIRRFDRKRPESQKLEEFYAEQPNVLETIRTLRERETQARTAIENARNTLEYERVSLDGSYGDDREMLELVNRTLEAVEAADIQAPAAHAAH